jgi:hypothetical protein
MMQNILGTLDLSHEVVIWAHSVGGIKENTQLGRDTSFTNWTISHKVCTGELTLQSTKFVTT